MTSRLKVIVFVVGLCAVTASTASALTVTGGRAGTAVVGQVHEATVLAEHIGSTLVDFYAALPAGVPIGP